MGGNHFPLGLHVSRDVTPALGPVSLFCSKPEKLALYSSNMFTILTFFYNFLRSLLYLFIRRPTPGDIEEGVVDESK